MGRTKGSRGIPRVPKPWADSPVREEEEQRLRTIGLQHFPESFEPLECTGCGKRGFYVWYDRVRCRLCALYYYIESSSRPFSRLPTALTDGAIPCPCGRFMYYVYKDRLKCVFCHVEYEHLRRLTHYWCMEDIGMVRKPAYRQIIGKSGVLKQIKKLKDKEGLNAKEEKPPVQPGDIWSAPKQSGIDPLQPDEGLLDDREAGETGHGEQGRAGEEGEHGLPEEQI